MVLLAAGLFVLGKLGLRLATVHPSATAVWPPPGIAHAAILMFGYWVWPGIFLGAFAVNLTTTGSILTVALFRGTRFAFNINAALALRLRIVSRSRFRLRSFIWPAIDEDCNGEHLREVFGGPLGHQEAQRISPNAVSPRAEICITGGGRPSLRRIT